MWPGVPGEGMDAAAGTQGGAGTGQGRERRAFLLKLRRMQEDEAGPRIAQAQVLERRCVLGREEGQGRVGRQKDYKAGDRMRRIVTSTSPPRAELESWKEGWRPDEKVRQQL